MLGMPSTLLLDLPLGTHTIQLGMALKKSPEKETRSPQKSPGHPHDPARYDLSVGYILFIGIKYAV